MGAGLDSKKVRWVDGQHGFGLDGQNGLGLVRWLAAMGYVLDVQSAGRVIWFAAFATFSAAPPCRVVPAFATLRFHVFSRFLRFLRVFRVFSRFSCFFTDTLFQW